MILAIFLTNAPTDAGGQRLRNPAFGGGFEEVTKLTTFASGMVLRSRPQIRTLCDTVRRDVGFHHRLVPAERTVFTGNLRRG